MNELMREKVKEKNLLQHQQQDVVNTGESDASKVKDVDYAKQEKGGKEVDLLKMNELMREKVKEKNLLQHQQQDVVNTGESDASKGKDVDYAKQEKGGKEVDLLKMNELMREKVKEKNLEKKKEKKPEDNESGNTKNGASADDKKAEELLKLKIKEMLKNKEIKTAEKNTKEEDKPKIVDNENEKSEKDRFRMAQLRLQSLQDKAGGDKTTKNKEYNAESQEASQTSADATATSGMTKIENEKPTAGKEIKEQQKEVSNVLKDVNKKEEPTSSSGVGNSSNNKDKDLTLLLKKDTEEKSKDVNKDKIKQQHQQQQDKVSADAAKIENKQNINIVTTATKTATVENQSEKNNKTVESDKSDDGKNAVKNAENAKSEPVLDPYTTFRRSHLVHHRHHHKHHSHHEKEKRNDEVKRFLQKRKNIPLHP